MDCVIGAKPESVTVMTVGRHNEVAIRFNLPPGDGAREFSGVCRRCNTTATIHELHETPCNPRTAPAAPPQADGCCP